MTAVTEAILSPIDSWFLRQQEPERACLQFLRSHIMDMDSRITETWKYGMPIFCINGKMACYLWIHKKYKQPYLGIVEGKRMHHPDLIQEKRARMKILLINPAKNIPVRKLNAILKEMLALYK